MKTIKILGTGCAKCKQTERIIQKTLEEIGVEANIEKVTNVEDIFSYDVMVTPAVVIDEQVYFTGKVPSKEEIVELIG